MRKVVYVMVAGLVLAGTVAYADLQNVTVGGQIELRFRWYHNAFETLPGGPPGAGLRVPYSFILGRTPGWSPGLAPAVPADPGLAPGVWSIFRYNHKQPDLKFVEETTSLNFNADFTENVRAFIEFYSYDKWGEDFRSNYLTGIDNRASTTNDVEVLQSYIEMDKMLGQDLRLRIGRQVMQFGTDLNCFLLGGKTTPTNRFAYDGVRATYKPMDKLTIDAWWMKLAELSPVEEDGDTDFYGVFGTYAFSDAAKLSGYWLFLRDAQKVQDTAHTFIYNKLEHVFGRDDYPVTAFHTVGLNLAGKYVGFDYNVNVAYQFGDAGKLGAYFRKPWWTGFYGDTDAKYDNFGGDINVGYTFDTAWKIRPYLAGAYYEGQDNRSVSFLDWLNPLSKPKASVSFNRLFSDINYCPVINDNADMSNFWQVGGGVTMSPTEKVSIILRAYNTFVDKPFSWPLYVNVPRWIGFPSGRMPILPMFSFLDKKSNDNLGISLDTIVKYNYSKDLVFILYYGHLFTGDGLRDGAYVSYFGTMMNGGTGKTDADYVFLWSILKF